MTTKENQTKSKIKNSKYKKYWKYAGIATISILVILGILVAVNYSAAKELYNYAVAGRDNFVAAQDYIKKQDFSETTIQLRQAEENFENAAESLEKLKEFKYIPVARRQYIALENIITAGTQTASSIRKISELASSIIIAINKEGQEVSLASITPEEKKIILEKIYESALVHELELRHIKYQQQKEIVLQYKNQNIGIHRLDIVIEDKVIVELKACSAFNPVFEAQVLSYLHAANLRFGLLINFNTTRLKQGIKRFVI